MNFTYRNNIWKASATNSIIPTNSRPFINNDGFTSNISRTPFKANPIKHWRKQLIPYYTTKSSKQVSISSIETPNTVSYVHVTDPSCNVLNAQIMKENITKNTQPCLGVHVDNPSRCIGGTSNIRRSASTNLDKNYYQTKSQYLKAKCKTYSQNTTLGEKKTNGSYKSSTCRNEKAKCNIPVIYKPNNKSFQTQGSVSSSSYILRKKQNAMTNNFSSLKNAYGKTYIHKKPYYVNETGYDIQFIKGTNEKTPCCQV